MKWEAYHWAKVPCPSCGHVGIMKHGDSKWSCMVCGKALTEQGFSVSDNARQCPVCLACWLIEDGCVAWVRLPDRHGVLYATGHSPAGTLAVMSWESV